MRLQDKFLAEIDASPWLVSSSATDYPLNAIIEPHSHRKHQLIYAISGVMVVTSAMNQWTVPPSRGIWMPCGQVHAIRCIGSVRMRSVFVRPDSLPDMPAECRAVAISPLLSELIRTAVDITQPYAGDSREARVMRLILDELRILGPAQGRPDDVQPAIDRRPGQAPFPAGIDDGVDVRPGQIANRHGPDDRHDPGL